MQGGGNNKDFPVAAPSARCATRRIDLAAAAAALASNAAMEAMLNGGTAAAVSGTPKLQRARKAREKPAAMSPDVRSGDGKQLSNAAAAA